MKLQIILKRISYFLLTSLMIGCISEKKGLSPEEKDIINQKYYNSKRDQKASLNLVKNIFDDAKHGTLKCSPARVKGRMLYQLITHTYWLWSDYNVNGDGDQACEEAALTVIKTIKHGREWQEVMEHIAIKNLKNTGYKPFDKDIAKNNPELVLSPNESILFLKRLIDDVNDWNILCDHINNNIESLDEALKLEREKEDSNK